MSADTDDGLNSYERMLKHGATPCHKCIWFKGEVTVLCESHQHLADQVPADPDFEPEVEAPWKSESI